MLDLLLVEHAVVPESRHVRASVVGLRVVDLAEGVFLDRFGIAAQFAESKQAGPNCPV